MLTLDLERGGRLVVTTGSVTTNLNAPPPDR